MHCLGTRSWAACCCRRLLARVGCCRHADALWRQAFQGWSKYLGLQAGHRHHTIVPCAVELLRDRAAKVKVGKIRHLAHPLNGRVLLVIMAS